jgi:hypothetical protein
VHEIAADEAGAAGDQYLHCCSFEFSASDQPPEGDNKKRKTVLLQYDEDVL